MSEAARAADSGVRLAELMAALSIATDLGMGQPLESALSSCLVAMRLGEALSLDDQMLHDVYYQALLRYIGCNAETDAMAALFGDELALRHDFAGVDTGRPPDVLGVALRYLRQARVGEPPLRTAAFIARTLLTLPSVMSEAFTGHCEVAQRLAHRLGFGESLIACLGQLYERWDGKGLPHKLKGDQVALPVQVVTLAQDAVFWLRVGGQSAAVDTIRKRGGGAYQPRLAHRFCEAASSILADLDVEPTWESVLSLDPQRGLHVAPTRSVPMSAEANAAAYRRWFDEGCSQGNVDLADEMYSPEYVTHSVGPDFAPTRDGLKLFIRALRQGMPDLQCPVEEVVAEDDRVGGRFTLQGTHAGTLLGIPATGKRVNVGVMVIARFDAAGKWVEDWASWDQLGLLQQIGVAPAPAHA